MNFYWAMRRASGYSCFRSPLQARAKLLTFSYSHHVQYISRRSLSSTPEGNVKTKIEGMLSVEDFKRLVNAGEIDTCIVAFTDMQGRFLGKRYDASYVAERTDNFEAHACSYLLATDMEMSPLAGFKAANWGKGYGDFHMQPDWTTLRRASWLPRSAYLFCDVTDPDTHEPLPHAPRSILKNQIARAEKLGFGADCASELEYYIYNTPYWEAAQKGYAKIEPAGWYGEDYHILQGTRTEDFNSRARKHLRRSGVPVENTKGEFGLGQHELNVVYADVLTMADRHCILKQCLKEIAERMGQSVTFMAKPHADQAGSSCHIHLNLTDSKDGTNAFAKDYKIFQYFLGGWLKHMPDIMPFVAPTINSYKRYRTASWAPTKIAWSQDNRTAGFRVVGKPGSKGLRIECRIPGADCHPYLGFAGCLAAGLDGVENKIEPPPEFKGDAYNAAELPSVPATLHDATESMEKSEFMKRAFGEDVVEHYVRYFHFENQNWNTAVTDWELKRYFEQI